MQLSKLLELERKIKNTEEFSLNTNRKNYFLAACLCYDSKLNIASVNEECPFGGIIGVGDSYLENFLGFFKLFKLHAVLHDASGFMKTKYSTGPGYLYVFPSCPTLLNSCFIGHITGLVYCTFIKFRYPYLYRAFDI